jgi:hypothetical protein
MYLILWWALCIGDKIYTELSANLCDFSAGSCRTRQNILYHNVDDDDCVNVQVSLHWSDYEQEYDVYDDQGEYVTSTFKFVGAALLIACTYK